MIETLSFRYTNWRGEVSIRTVTPSRFWFGVTKWHREPQWLMNGYDHGKGADRDFAVVNCDFTFEGETTP